MYFKNKHLTFDELVEIKDNILIENIISMKYEIGETISRKYYQYEDNIYIYHKKTKVIQKAINANLENSGYINCYSIVHLKANQFLNYLEKESLWLKIGGGEGDIINQMSLLKDVLLIPNMKLVLKRIFILIKYSIKDQETVKEWKTIFSNYNKQLN